MKSHVHRANRLRLFVLLFLSCGSRGDYDELMLDRLTDSCPYLSTCSRTSDRQFPEYSGYTPCCRQCSCIDDCVTLDNCCPDVPENSTSNPEHLARFPEECISTAYPDQGGNGYSSSAMYYAVTSCPEDYPNGRITQQCADTTPEAIQQVALVSDTEGTIYRNMYCARCHNAPDPHMWPIGVTCGLTNGSINFQLDLSNIVQRGCVLSSQPPRNDADVLKKRCFRPDVTQCNVTGKWDVFDPVTQRTCSTETVLFIKSNTLYKNVFCFYCNNRKAVQNTIHSCQDLSVLPQKGMTTSPFWALLDPSLIIQSKTPSQRDVKGCKFNEMYDSYADVCRELHCPPGEAVNNGMCTQAFLQTIDFTMKLFFKIQQKESLPLTPNNDDLENIIYTTIRHVTKPFKKNRCSVCYLTALRYPSVPDAYFLRQVIQTTATCPSALALASAESVDNTSIPVEMAGNATTYTVEHVLKNLDESYLERTVILAPRLTFNYDTNCKPDGVPANDFHCPYVEISGLDYVTAVREGKLRETHRYETYNVTARTDGELANMTFEICVEDYLPWSSAGVENLYSIGIMTGCLIWLSMYKFAY